jgi:hypothetical protein
MGTKGSQFDDNGYEKAVRLLLEAMKLERTSRGLLSGEKPIDVEQEKQYDLEQLLDEAELVLKEGVLNKIVGGGGFSASTKNKSV